MPSKAEKLREARAKAKAWAAKKKGGGTISTPAKTPIKTPSKSKTPKSSSRSSISRSGRSKVAPREDDERTVSSVSKRSARPSRRNDTMDVESSSMAISRRRRDHPTDDEYDTEDDFLKKKRSKDHPKEEEYETEDDFLNASDSKKLGTKKTSRSSRQSTRHEPIVEESDSDASMEESPVPVKKGHQQRNDDSSHDDTHYSEGTVSTKKRSREAYYSSDEEESKKFKTGPTGTPVMNRDGEIPPSTKKSSGKKEALRIARLKAAEWAKKNAKKGTSSVKKSRERVDDEVEEDDFAEQIASSKSARSNRPSSPMRELSPPVSASRHRQEARTEHIISSPQLSSSPPPEAHRQPRSQSQRYQSLQHQPPHQPQRQQQQQQQQQQQKRYVAPAPAEKIPAPPSSSPARPHAALNDLVHTVERAAALAKEVGREEPENSVPPVNTSRQRQHQLQQPQWIQQGDAAGGRGAIIPPVPTHIYESHHTPQNNDSPKSHDEPITSPSPSTCHPSDQWGPSPLQTQPTETTPWYMNDTPDSRTNGTSKSGTYGTPNSRPYDTPNSNITGVNSVSAPAPPRRSSSLPSPPTTDTKTPRPRRRSLERRGGRRLSSHQQKQLSQMISSTNDDDAICAAAEVFASPAESEAALHGEVRRESQEQENDDDDAAIMNAVMMFGGENDGSSSGARLRGGDASATEVMASQIESHPNYVDRQQPKQNSSVPSSGVSATMPMVQTEKSPYAKERAEAQRNNMMMESYNAAIAKRVAMHNEKKKREEDAHKRQHRDMVIPRQPNFQQQHRQQQEQHHQQQQQREVLLEDTFQDAVQDTSGGTSGENQPYNYPTEEIDDDQSSVVCMFQKVKSSTTRVVTGVALILGAVIVLAFIVASLQYVIQSSHLSSDDISSANISTSMTNTISFPFSLKKKIAPQQPQKHVKKLLPPCFHDSKPPHPSMHPPKSLTNMGIISCRAFVDPNTRDAPLDPLPCPRHAQCSSGFLQTCVDGFEPGLSHDSCVPSQESITFLEELTKKVVDMTVQYSCGRCRFSKALCPIEVVDDTPRFNITSFLGLSEVETLRNLISHVDNNTLSATNETISLTQTFIQSRLPIPFTCYLALLTVSLTVMSLSLTMSAFKIMITSLFSCFKTHPLFSIAITIFLIIIQKIHSLHSRRVRIHNQTAELRERAYDKLIQFSQPVAMSHLRDDLAHELHPTSLRDRKNIVKTVWPRVCCEVRLDTRVRKVEKSVGGVGMEHWEWIAGDGGRTPMKS